MKLGKRSILRGNAFLQPPRRVIEICEPGAEPFRIGERHNVYEWAMIMADRHPYPGWSDRALLRADTRAGQEYREKMLRGEVQPLKRQP
jgi:hypothetical protein